MKNKVNVSEHTPTPWHSDLSTVHGPEIDAEYQEKQIVCSVINRADAAFIVKAVNCHEELLNALKAALYDVKNSMYTTSLKTIEKAIANAEQAISRATAKGDEARR